MLEATWQRLPNWIPEQQRLVVVEERHRERVKQLCPGILESHILSEPQGRDTAAAIALATAWVARQTPQATLIVLPADHRIQPRLAFEADLKMAAQEAQSTQDIVLIGVPPTRPETGYGYIELAAPKENLKTLPVKRFLEKPNKEQAQAYLEAGTFLWNCGLIVACVSTLQKAITRHLPQQGQLMAAVQALKEPAALPALLQRLYPGLPKISMDYGVLEACAQCRVLPAQFEWSDVGDWAALAQTYPQDALGNSLLGHGYLLDSHNAFVYNTQADHPVITIGLEDCVVVHTPSGTLVCSKAHAQAVRSARGLSASLDNKAGALHPLGPQVSAPADER